MDCRAGVTHHPIHTSNSIHYSIFIAHLFRCSNRKFGWHSPDIPKQGIRTLCSEV
jgi:hypothetical protein